MVEHETVDLVVASHARRIILQHLVLVVLVLQAGLWLFDRSLTPGQSEPRLGQAQHHGNESCNHEPTVLHTNETTWTPSAYILAKQPIPTTDRGNKWLLLTMDDLSTAWVCLATLLNHSGIALGGEWHTTGPSRELVERAPVGTLRLVYYVDTLHNNVQVSTSSYTFLTHGGDGNPSLERPTGEALSSASLVNGECVLMDVTISVLFYVNCRCGPRGTSTDLGVLATLLAEPSHEPSSASWISSALLPVVFVVVVAVSLVNVVEVSSMTMMMIS